MEEKSKTKIVKTIFTNVLFVLGVILLIAGFVRGVVTVVKLAVFEKYPLDTYEETRCETEGYARAVVPTEEGKVLTEFDKQGCLVTLEQSRKIKKVEDIAYSISFTLVGLVLMVSFKKYILEKEKK